MNSQGSRFQPAQTFLYNKDRKKSAVLAVTCMHSQTVLSKKQWQASFHFIFVFVIFKYYECETACTVDHCAGDDVD